jgi:CRISPR type III-B/RAMP module-associated protein Cmr5
MTHTDTTRIRTTLEQRRAKDAWDVIAILVERTKDRHAEDYARQIRKLPARIKTAGLGQALAFLSAKAEGKGDRAEQKVVNDLSIWVLKCCGRSGPELLEAIVNGDSLFLMRATEEALAWLRWAKRFCEARGLGHESTSDGGKTDA